MRTALAILLLLVSSSCVTREITARRFEVLRVIDGDTFVIMYDGELTSCRLYGIDTPELREPGGPEAKAALEAQILHQTVTLTFPGKRKRDPFGSLLVNIATAPTSTR